MVQGKVQFLSGDFGAAKQSFLGAREHAEAHADHRHLSHIAGDIGNCCMALGDLKAAQGWLERAVAHAREREQPALEASWLVEQGKIAMVQGATEDADRLAREALKIARPRDHRLTVFRAEWLRHRVARQTRPEEPDPERVARLHALFRQLDEHEGIDEIVEYKQSVRRAPEGG
jgi:tetratricopeptide (TPR) repeat protein